MIIDPTITVNETITTTEIDPITEEEIESSSIVPHEVVLPAKGGTLATVDGEETLSNKTLMDPTIKVHETVTTTETVTDSETGEPVLDPETGAETTTTTTEVVERDLILPVTGGIYTDAVNHHYIYGESYASNTKPSLRISNSATSATVLTANSTSTVQYSFHGYIYGFTNLTLPSSAVQLF